MVLTSCGDLKNDIVYSHFRPVAGQVWNDSTEYFFSFSISDPGAAYEVMGIIRYTPEIRVQSIPVGIVKEDASTEKPGFRTEVLQIKLPVHDEAVSESHYVMHEARFAIEESISFAQKGVYTYSMRHLTDVDSIAGITEVGLIVRKL